MEVSSRTIAIFAITIIVIVGIYAYRTRDIPFAADAWRTELSQRSRMVHSLLSDHQLAGASRYQIHNLLGVPARGPDSVRGSRYIYWAGTATIDDMWLEILFSDDRVVDVRYIPD